MAVLLSAGAAWADLPGAPTWRLSGRASAAVVRGDLVYVGGPFTQLFTPSTSQDQFYDRNTAQVLTQCARSTTERPLVGTPDGRGGLLVTVRSGDAWADTNGVFDPPANTAILRIGEDCLWDRQFAAPAIDQNDPTNLTIGLPVRVGSVVMASNTVAGPFGGFLRAQVAAYDAVTGARIWYQFYDNVSEIGFLGASSTRVIARVRGQSAGAYTLGAITPTAALTLTQSLSVLADENAATRSWIRGQTLYRARPAPVSTVEAYDLTTLNPKSGWTAPVVPNLVDLEVVGARVFLTATRVNNQAVSPPAAVLAATGALDASWTPAALTLREPDPTGVPYVPALTQLATDGQRLFLGGDFQRIAGSDRAGVGALSAATGGLEAWDPAPFPVVPLEFSNGGMLMSRPSGTNFVTRRYLAAIDRDTGQATPWNPNDAGRVLMHEPSPVSALAVDATHVYFASATSGEILRASVATAEVDQAWRVKVMRDGSQPGSVVSMLLSGGRLYLGGEFEAISGLTIPRTARSALAAVSLEGALANWAPVLEGEESGTLLRTMLALDRTVFLGGDFTSVGGQSRPGFAAVDSVTGELVQPEMFVLGDTRIYGLATDTERTFVAGVSFGAPLVGATSIPDTELTRFGPTFGVVPTHAAYLKGRLYAGLEYDVEAGESTDSEMRWAAVFADDRGLVHLPADNDTIEYYEALPGNPPDPPTLTALATGNRVDIAWSRAPGGGAPTSYTLAAGSSPGTTNLGSVVVRGATTFTTELPTGFYYLTAVARNADGASAPSNEVPLQVGCVVAPPAPDTLRFTRAGLSARFTWGAAVTAASYRLDAGTVSGSTNLGSFVLPNATVFTGTAPLGVYYVRLRAVNRCGVSPASNEVVVNLDGTVAVPNPPSAVAATSSGGSVTLSWTPPTTGGTAASYRVEGGRVGGGVLVTLSTSGTTLVVPNVAAGTYFVRVRSVNAAGVGAATADVTVTVP